MPPVGHLQAWGPRVSGPTTEDELLIQVFLDMTDILVEMFLLAKKQTSKYTFWKQSNIIILETQSIKTRKKTMFEVFLKKIPTAVSAVRQEVKSPLENSHVTCNFNMNNLIPVSLLSNTGFLGLHYQCMSHYLHTSTIAVKLNEQSC